MRLLLFILFAVTGTAVFAQQSPVLVAEVTKKVKGIGDEEALYYGFEAGDEIILSVTEEKGKGIGSVTVERSNGQQVFSDLDVVKINQKRIPVPARAVYKFGFSHSGLGSRACKIKIERVPASAQTRAFNPGWEWAVVKDTTFENFSKDTLAGYDTLMTRQTQRVLVAHDTVYTKLLDRAESLNGRISFRGTGAYQFNFQIPEDTYLPDVDNVLESKELIAWAFWLGVDQEEFEHRQAMREEANAETQLSEAPFERFVRTGLANFFRPSIGEDITYELRQMRNTRFTRTIDGQFRGRFKILDQGKSATSYKRYVDDERGNMIVWLGNDNLTRGVSVQVKVGMYQVHRKWEDRMVDVPEVTPRYITLKKTRRYVESKKMRVNVAQ